MKKKEIKLSKSVIIAGFPGVGKSYITKAHPEITQDSDYGICEGHPLHHSQQNKYN